MKVTRTPVDGCLKVEFPVHSDGRGYFQEMFHAIDFIALDLPGVFHQDNLSYSKKDVLRGLHLQTKNPQGKLVRCLKGRIWDVCLDVREDSPSLGQWTAAVLDENEQNGLYCPPGTAHGFVVLSDEALVMYKCTQLYNQETDTGINPFDKDLQIPWPVIDPIISPKDKHLPSLHDFLNRPR